MHLVLMYYQRCAYPFTISSSIIVYIETSWMAYHLVYITSSAEGDIVVPWVGIYAYDRSCSGIYIIVCLDDWSWRIPVYSKASAWYVVYVDLSGQVDPAYGYQTWVGHWVICYHRIAWYIYPASWRWSFDLYVWQDPQAHIYADHETPSHFTS